ncbi:MAG: hypothetical protein AAGI50_18305 [Pseudomonadota bacterium]
MGHNRSGIAAGLLSVCCLPAMAGGLERNIPSIATLFEEGRYLEFSVTYVTPDLSGDDGAVPGSFIGSPVDVPITGNTGDLLEDYATFGASFKADITDRISYALIFSQPLGANTEYETDPTADGAPPFTGTEIYNGSNAELTSYELTAILSYEVGGGFRVYGGPVAQTIEAEAELTFIPPNVGYRVESDTSLGFGFMGGVAYEIPEFALRASLTYRSSISHEFDTEETIGTTVVESTTDIDTPQSLTFDFQTGVTQITLVFGQVHWVDWSEFEISPPNYPLLAPPNNRPLVSYEEDYITYTLGVAQRLTERWAGSFAVTWEPQTGQELTSLGPVDGRIGLTAGARYETDRIRISGGVTYNFLGDAENVLLTDYDGGSALGVGLRIGFKL